MRRIPQCRGVLRRLSLHIPVLLVTAAMVSAAPLPPEVKKLGVVITAEGGIEGTQVYRYDAEGRALEGTPANSRVQRPPSPSGGAGLPSAGSPPSSVPAPAPVVNQAIKTADGRTVPFSVQGKGIGKSVDEAVDFNAGLKKAGKTSGLMGERFEAGMAPIGKEQIYSRNNLVTLDSWHGRYDTLGRKKADIELKDTLGAEVRPKDTIEVKSVDRMDASMNGSMAEVRKWEERMGVEPNTRYAGVRSAWEGRLNQGPKTVDQLSMQDINRYQFRRNRSDAPGLPVVKPGSEEVQNKGGK